MEYFYVAGHLYGDYLARIKPEDDPDELLEQIEETCPTCGDSDFVLDKVSNLQKALKVAKEQQYNPEYLTKLTYEMVATLSEDLFEMDKYYTKEQIKTKLGITSQWFNKYLAPVLKPKPDSKPEVYLGKDLRLIDEKVGN